MDMEAGTSEAAPATSTSLTPITEGARPYGGKKRQRPQTSSAAATAAGEQSLRGFASKVCTVVRSRRETTYQDVADALVDEIIGAERTPDQENESKNMRRYERLTPCMHTRACHSLPVRHADLSRA